MRREATTLRPAFSKRSTMAPVRFRRVASGLMMERVRSTAMGVSGKCEKCAGYSGGRGKSKIATFSTSPLWGGRNSSFANFGWGAALSCGTAPHPDRFALRPPHRGGGKNKGGGEKQNQRAIRPAH